jgi:sensor c-di-GMP phosphodiesterase-like protein
MHEFAARQSNHASLMQFRTQPIGLKIESDLHRALAHTEFELFYQPQVDLKIGNIVGARSP